MQSKLFKHSIYLCAVLLWFMSSVPASAQNPTPTPTLPPLEAIATAEHALQQDDRDAEAYVLRGSGYLEQKRFDEAIADFDRALEIDPDYAEAHRLRGNAFYRQDMFEEALENYTRAI